MEGAASATRTSDVPPASTVTIDAGDGGVRKKVKITVQKEHAQDITFSLKCNAPLGKLMFEYCQRMGVNYKEFKFTYLGKEIRDFDTPDFLEMEEEDILDCWSEQFGGGGGGGGAF